MTTRSAKGRAAGTTRPRDNGSGSPASVAPPEPPHSEETERALLGALFLATDLQPDLPERISALVRPGDFYVERHRLIYDAMMALREQGRGVDALTVQLHLEDAGHLERCGGLAELIILSSPGRADLPVFDHAADYAAAVAELAARRRLAQGLAGLDLRTTPLPEIHGTLEALVAASAPRRRGGYRALSEILEDPEMLEPPAAVAPGLAWKGRVTLFAAREKLGKSTLASYCAAAVSRGGDCLAGECEPGAVLWYRAEEHVGELARRLVRFHADTSRFFVMDPEPGPLEAIRAAATELQPALIVIDTLPALTSGMGLESASEWTPVLLHLVETSRQTGAAMVLVHHANKSSGTYRDSTAIGASVDQIVEMQGVENDDTARVLKSSGRFGNALLTIRYLTDRYEVAAGRATVDVRVLAHLQEHPEGSTSSLVASGVQARKSDALTALQALERERLAYRRQSGKSHLWFKAGTGPGTDGEAVSVPSQTIEGTGRNRSEQHREQVGARSVPAPIEKGAGNRSLARSHRVGTEGRW